VAPGRIDADRTSDAVIDLAHGMRDALPLADACPHCTTQMLQDLA
jgi:hypothetical protein